MRDEHAEHLPRDRGGYMTTWQSYVVHGELAVSTVIGTEQRARMAPGAADPNTGLVALHSSVIVQIGVALETHYLSDTVAAK
jgi:hypothetical protein